MSGQQLENFLELAKNDLLLQDQIKSAKSESNVVEIAKNAGFYISIGDISRFQARVISELSDHELENVSGGTIHTALYTVLHCLGVAALTTGVVLGTEALFGSDKGR